MTNANHECPYCGKPQEHCNDEPFDQDEIWDEECNDCGKSYRLQGWYTEEYNAEKADCLNGAAHDFRQIVGAPEEWFIGKFRCVSCEEEEHRGGHYFPEVTQ
jgi:hypothetical protein